LGHLPGPDSVIFEGLADHTDPARMRLFGRTSMQFAQAANAGKKIGP
jgi:hypothetical protein